MIRYDAGILTVQFHPLQALCRFIIASTIALSIFVPVTEIAQEVEPRPAQPAWLAAAGVVEDTLERKTTYPADMRRVVARAVAKESEAAKFDPLFILAVIEAESGFDHVAVSTWKSPSGACYVNARGIMQIVDKTWADEIKRRGLPRMDRFDPAANVIVGVGYLAHLRDRGYKSLNAVLTAYLLGPAGALPVLYGKGEPEPTAYAAAYVKRVRFFYERNLAERGQDPKQARKLYALR